ncbi:hypothetical protein I79_011245 [Cricetulus griseus]|uniref:Uncharacterized protein n=1 Tax=Cricetulus griseus TaxID=10029 RepID=G3HKL6_CRIGR|nr:hypothetical protein I79_011245 [Cricetulus griseus]
MTLTKLWLLPHALPCACWSFLVCLHISLSGGFLLPSPLAQEVLTNAFQRKPHFLPSEHCGRFELVSLKKVLVVNHWNSITNWESRFFLEYTVKNPKFRRSQEYCEPPLPLSSH